MTDRFKVIDGALRLRLNPEEFADVAQEASAVGEAVRLARGGLVMIEAVTRRSEVGLHLCIGLNGGTAAAVIQRARITAEGSTQVDPGAEVSIFPVDAVLAEILRCVPSRPDFAPEDHVEHRVPWEAAAAIARDNESPEAQYAMALVGWGELPEAVASVLGSVTCEVAVTMTSSQGTALRRWISGDSGWLGMGFAGQELVLEPSTRADMTRALTRDLAQAVDSMLEGAR